MNIRPRAPAQAQRRHHVSQSWSCTPLQTLLIHQPSLDVSSATSQCKRANTQTSMADHSVGDVGIRFIRIWLPKRTMPERHFLATNQARLGAVVGQDLPLTRGARLRAVAPKLGRKQTQRPRPRTHFRPFWLRVAMRKVQISTARNSYPTENFYFCPMLFRYSTVVHYQLTTCQRPSIPPLNRYHGIQTYGWRLGTLCLSDSQISENIHFSQLTLTCFSVDQVARSVHRVSEHLSDQHSLDSAFI